MLNEFHGDLSKYEWWQYHQHVNNYDWDAELRKSSFEFYIVIGGKLIKSKYSKGKPRVLEIYTASAFELIPYDGGMIYDTDTKQILDKLTETTKQVHKGADDYMRQPVSGEGDSNGRTEQNDGKRSDADSDYEALEQANSDLGDIKDKRDAHERAERWAHDDSFDVRAQKLASYNDRWFIIEKFESLEYGYQIMGSGTIWERTFFGLICYQHLHIQTLLL